MCVCVRVLRVCTCTGRTHSDESLTSVKLKDKSGSELSFNSDNNNVSTHIILVKIMIIMYNSIDRECIKLSVGNVY